MQIEVCLYNHSPFKIQVQSLDLLHHTKINLFYGLLNKKIKIFCSISSCDYNHD